MLSTSLCYMSTVFNIYYWLCICTSIVCVCSVEVDWHVYSVCWFTLWYHNRWMWCNLPNIVWQLPLGHGTRWHRSLLICHKSSQTHNPHRGDIIHPIYGRKRIGNFPLLQWIRRQTKKIHKKSLLVIFAFEWEFRMDAKFQLAGLSFDGLLRRTRFLCCCLYRIWSLDYEGVYWWIQRNILFGRSQEHLHANYKNKQLRSSSIIRLQ